MRARRRFTAEFKARVALEALRGDRTIQEIAARHAVHPNRAATQKRRRHASDNMKTRHRKSGDFYRPPRTITLSG